PTTEGFEGFDQLFLGRPTNKPGVRFHAVSPLPLVPSGPRCRVGQKIVTAGLRPVHPLATAAAVGRLPGCKGVDALGLAAVQDAADIGQGGLDVVLGSLPHGLDDQGVLQPGRQVGPQGLLDRRAHPPAEAQTQPAFFQRGRQQRGGWLFWGCVRGRLRYSSFSCYITIYISINIYINSLICLTLLVLLGKSSICLICFVCLALLAPKPSCFASFFAHIRPFLCVLIQPQTDKGKGHFCGGAVKMWCFSRFGVRQNRVKNAAFVLQREGFQWLRPLSIQDDTFLSFVHAGLPKV